MSDNVRRDNRRALPKYLLTILLFGLLGGVLGFFTGVAGAAGVAETVRQALDRVLAVCAPWGIVGSAVVGAEQTTGSVFRSSALISRADGHAVCCHIKGETDYEKQKNQSYIFDAGLIAVLFHHAGICQIEL